MSIQDVAEDVLGEFMEQTAYPRAAVLRAVLVGIQMATTEFYGPRDLITMSIDLKMDKCEKTMARRFPAPNSVRASSNDPASPG